MRRKEALYAVIGGVVGAVLTMVCCLFMPFVAQSQSEVAPDGVFGQITCRGMKVVDSEGKLGVLIFNGDYGGRVDVFGKDGNPRAGMLITEHGGQLAVLDKDHKAGVVMAVTKYGNGAVNTWDKNGSPLATLK